MDRYKSMWHLFLWHLKAHGLQILDIQLNQHTRSLICFLFFQQQQVPTQRKPIKIYKCMSCDFKTTDIKLFQPHYDTCRQQNGYRCKLCKKIFTSVGALKAHNVEKHTSEFTCSICNINYMNEGTYKKHMESNHADIKTIEPSSTVATGKH